MKNVLNAVTAICIILFLGWQFCGDCCEKKCDKSDTKECDYSKCEKSGATKCDYSKCKKTGTKKECPHANNEEIDVEDSIEEVTDNKEDNNTFVEYLKEIGFTEEEIEQLQLETDISDKLED